MGKIADKIKDLLYDFFNSAIKDNSDFFNKPTALTALKLVAIAALVPITSNLKKIIESKLSSTLNKSSFNNIVDRKNISDDDVKNYIKRNKNLRKFMNYVGNELNEDLASDVVLACSNSEYYSKKTDKLKGILSKIKGGIDGNTFINVATKESDFDQRINKFKIDKGLKGILNNVNGNLPWIFMTYFIIIKVKEFLNQSEHPSPYRGKYLQKMIRLVATSLQNESNAVKSIPSETLETSQQITGQILEVINSLKSIDSIIVGSLMASFVYLNNIKQYQEESSSTLSEISSSISCEEDLSMALSDDETSINYGSLEINIDTFTCPIEDKDDVAVPHEPFEDKLSDKRIETCEIVQNNTNPSDIEGDFVSDTASKALIENNSNQKFSFFVKKDQSIDTRTIIGSLGGRQVYSPVDGIISKIEDNKIYIDDVSDPENTYLEEIIKQIQDLYKELNNIKFFIKDFYIISWYPSILRVCDFLEDVEGIPELNLRRIYRNIGIQKRFQNALASAKSANDIFEQNVQEITGEKNVKEKSENEELIKIKEEVDEQEVIFYNSLKQIANRELNQSETTLAKKSDFILVDYYFNLLNTLLSNYDQNEIIVPFRDKINEFLVRRYFIDGWNKNTLIRKVNDLCNELAEGTFFEDEPNFFIRMLQVYNQNKKKIKPVKDYINSLGENNTEFTTNEKNEIIEKVMYLFNFVLEITQKINEEFSIDTDRYQATEEEANYIENYFGQKWIRYNQIPGEIDNLFKILEDLGQTLTTYSIIDIDDEEYRYYSIGKERDCPTPSEEDDEYLSPFSAFEYKDIQYWLKYCAFATLASVTNPATGWSTGLPPPIGPTLLPVVYIPFKSFQLNWGFIVIGLTITGIYPFPWVLISNLSSEYHVPLADPATIIRNNIEALKKVLTDQIKEFRQVVLRNYLNQSKQNIDTISIEIDTLAEEKRLHKLEKPRRDRSRDNDLVIYTKELARWRQTQTTYSEQILSLKTKRFNEETKYQIVYNAFSGSKINEEDAIDPKLNSIQKNEEKIDKQFSKLDSLINSIEPFLSPLPISTKPESANFAFTLKNPRPIINFGDNLNETVNKSSLDPILKKFKFENSSFMKTNFSADSQKSFVNWEKYKNTLKTSKLLLIQKDPFPKYENLNLANIRWISFLYNNWVPEGAKTYGIPAFGPFPT